MRTTGARIASDRATEAYAAEIRRWLVGRLGRGVTSGTIDRPHDVSLIHAPITNWWIFEGRRYPGLEGALCQHWFWIRRHAEHLLSTYNPAWRHVDAPEGETDWIKSAFHSLVSGRRTFVSKTSASGLGAAEREALLGWFEWLRKRWTDYVRRVRVPTGASSEVPSLATDARGADPDEGRIARWAHTAKRSRWPLLRNVAAESLRCVLEEEQIDRLPLPPDRDRLFELVCMVRILDAVHGKPKHIRWLDHELGRNTVHVPGMRYHHQHHIDRDEVLGTNEFDDGLRNAIERHRVRIPRFIDGWLEFEEPVNGFDGIIIEAKAGSQTYDATIYQLKAYRAALRGQGVGRLLVWGIVEEGEEAQEGDGTELRVETAASEDCWVFSTARDIEPTLRSLGFVEEVNDIRHGVVYS